MSLALTLTVASASASAIASSKYSSVVIAFELGELPRPELSDRLAGILGLRLTGSKSLSIGGEESADLINLHIVWPLGVTNCGHLQIADQT